MNDQDEVRTEGASSGGPDASGTGRPAVVPRRRRLLSGGLAAAPILLTVGSRSALATGLCPSPSRVFSGMASPNPSDHFDCNGRSPGYWKVCQSFGIWPVDRPTVNKDGVECENGIPPLAKASFSGGDYGANFYDLFAAGCASPLQPVVSPIAGRAVSMWEILAYPTEVRDASGVAEVTVPLARHCIAAYFNALTLGSTYPITSGQALAMWADGSCGGYCPLESCSVPWNPTQIIDYITSTFTGGVSDWP